MKKIFSLTSLIVVGLLFAQKGKAPSSPKKERILLQEEKSAVLTNKNNFRQHFKTFSTSNATFDICMSDEVKEFLNTHIHKDSDFYYGNFTCRNKNFICGFNVEGCAVEIFEAPSPNIFFEKQFKRNALDCTNSDFGSIFFGYLGTYQHPINNLFNFDNVYNFYNNNIKGTESLIDLVFKERKSFRLKSKAIEKMKQLPQGQDYFVYLQTDKRLKQALDLKKGVLVFGQIFLKFVEIFVNDGELCLLEEEEARDGDVQALQELIEGFDVVKTVHLALHSRFLALDFANPFTHPLSKEEFMEQTVKMKEMTTYEEKNTQNIQLLQQKVKEALTLKEYHYIVSFLSQDVKQINFHGIIDGFAERLPYSIASLFKFISLKVYPVFLGTSNYPFYLKKPDNSAYVQPSFMTNFLIDEEYYSPKAALCVNIDDIFISADQEEKNFIKELGKQMYFHVQRSLEINDIENCITQLQRALLEECIEETNMYSELFVLYFVKDQQPKDKKFNFKILFEEKNYIPTKKQTETLIEKYILFHNMKSTLGFPLLFKGIAASHPKYFDILTEGCDSIFVHTNELVKKIFHIYDNNHRVKNYIMKDLLFFANIAYDIIYKNTDNNNRYSKSLEDLIKDL